MLAIYLTIVENVENAEDKISLRLRKNSSFVFFLDILFHAPMTNQYLPILKFDTAGREHGLKILPQRSTNAAFAAVKKSVSAV